MNILNKETPEKPEINYPTDWGFKIIGRDKDALEKCIKDIMQIEGNKKHLCSMGNQSKTGKFTTFNATCSVESEEERNRIFKYFKDHDDVEMVI